MNLQDFKRLEKELGHPPTCEEVKEHQARPMLKAAQVKFTDSKYNYITSVNGKLGDAEIIEYFKNKWFNLGSIEDDMQKCIECKVTKSSIGFVLVILSIRY
ncbi:unnamed protein product [marine sediment metagenome]|uniref:Uncharacterized protein n=1 Tax=marine sediment metagenome TaxID=412755 RepID=X1A7B7_9ZZZZ